MVTGLTFALLSVLSSVLIAHGLRWGEEHKFSQLSVLASNYISASVFSFFMAGREEAFKLPEISVLILAAVVGIFFLANFWIFSRSLKINGISPTVTMMRMSLIIPVLGGILVYNEVLSLFLGLGILLVFISMYLLTRQSKKESMISKVSAPILLILLFFISGTTDFSLKIFEATFLSDVSEYMFMGSVFGSSCIAAWFLVIVRKEKFSSKAFMLGLLIGIPNLYSSIFLIKALTELPSAITYTFINIGIILSSALLGLLYWKDKLTHRQRWGLVTAVASIPFLFI
jgi:drug/metabolite transporter (DMT)-like permease